MAKVTPEELHATMLKMALAGESFEEIKTSLMSVGEMETRINYIWNHGVVKPQLPSIMYLLNDRKMAMALQEKQDRLDASQRELELASKEREVTDALVKSRQQVQSALEAARLRAETETVKQLVETGKNVAALNLGQVAGFLVKAQEFSAVFEEKISEWLIQVKNQPASYQLLSEGVKLLQSMTRAAKDALLTAKLAAEVAILLKDFLPQEDKHNLPEEKVIQENPTLIVHLYERQQRRLGLPKDPMTIDSES